MCPEVDTKQHKKARFFMKTSYFFGENNLKSFFRPGCQWVYLIMLLKISHVKKNLGQAVSDSMTVVFQNM